ncbi:MAG: outer membrane protein OmpT [Cocleimonas sp.]|jgi:outer membrane protein OmpT
MKKTLLAVAIPAMIFANSASAVDIYKTEKGSVDFYGQLRTEVKKNEGKDVTLNAGSSRTGVSANYALTESIKAFGKVEFGLNYAADGSDYSMKNRLHFVGVEGEFGKVSLGRQWVIADDIYGADYSYFFGGSALRYLTLSGARHDSLIKYNYDNENFWVAANIGLAEDDSNQELAEFFAGTSFDALSVHVGAGKNRDKTFKTGTYTKTGNEVKTNVTADLENTYFEGTVEYTLGDALIGFTYYNSALENKGNDQKIKENGYSLAGTYGWADNATAYTGFEFTDQDASASDVKDGDSKVFYIGSDYQINEWTRVYAEYAYLDGRTLSYSNKASDTFVGVKEATKDSAFAIGARVYW